MKRKIAATLAMLMFTQTAYAASSVNEPIYENGVLTITGTAQIANMPVKLEVFKKGVEYSAVENANADNISDIYMNIKQVNAGEDGSFSIEVPVEAELGNYLIRVGFFGGEMIEESYATYTQEELNTAIDAFITDPAKDANTLEQLIEDYYSGLKVNYTDLKSLTPEEEALAYQNIVLEVTTEFTKEEFVTALNKEISVRQISKNATPKLLERYASVLGFKDSLYYEEYMKLSDEEKESLAKKCEGAIDAAAIDTALKNAVILGEISESLWNECYSVITKYNEYISFNFTNLDKVPENSESRKNIMSGLKDSVANGVITDVSMLQNEVEALIKKYPYVQQNNGGTGGGVTGGGGSITGGGGGSIGGGSVSAPVNNNVYTGTAGQTVTDKRVFDDIETYSWAEEAILRLYGLGVINGKSDKSFKPADYVTREEFIAMIVRGFKFENQVETPKFSDVDTERWSSDYLHTAVSNGIVTGYENGKFAPASNIVRQDMAVIAARAAEAAGKKLSYAEGTAFADADQIAQYAKKSIAALETANIINGKDGGFVPHDFTNRAEAAVVIYRIMKYCGKI